MRLKGQLVRPALLCAASLPLNLILSRCTEHLQLLDSKLGTVLLDDSCEYRRYDKRVPPVCIWAPFAFALLSGGCAQLSRLPLLLLMAACGVALGLLLALYPCCLAARFSALAASAVARCSAVTSVRSASRLARPAS